MLTKPQVQLLLKQMVAEFEAPRLAQVSAKVHASFPRYAPILDWVMREFQDENKKRWYEPYHVLYSTSFAIKLVECGQADELIIPGVLLHDVGYFAIPNKESWNHPQNRVLHMQESAALAAKVLAANHFTPDELEIVVGMIAVHDNPYLGYPIVGETRLCMRDCDRVWVMHPISFYKDWTSKSDSDFNSSPWRLLGTRRVHFFGAEDAAIDMRWRVDDEVISRAASRVEKPHTNAAKRHIEKQFEARLVEIEDKDFFSTEEAFCRRFRDVMRNDEMLCA